MGRNADSQAGEGDQPKMQIGDVTAEEGGEVNIAGGNIDKKVIDTGGGAYIEGNIKVGGGDLVVGDKIVVEGDRKAQKELSRQQKWIIATGIATTLIALTILGFILFPLFIPQPVMTGDVNVAVAKFGEVDGQGRVVASKVGAALAQSYYEQLDGEILKLEQELKLTETSNLMYDIQVRRPEEVGQIKGSTPEEREENAALLAQTIQADLIVYGYLQITEDQTKFIPEFFINDRQLTQAEELTGQHEVQSNVHVPFNITKNSTARSELRQKLIGGPRTLAIFVIGLSNFMFNSFDTALAYFQQALEVTDVNDPEIRKIFLLFLGKTAHETRNWDIANDYYSQAL